MKSVVDRKSLEHLVLDFQQMRDFATDPFIIESGDGIRITDTKGKTYIDGLSGVFVVSLGHRNQAVLEAMHAQLQALSFAPPLHGTNPRAIELAESLRQITPAGIGSVKFLSGGSEAVETALKLARQYYIQTGHPHKFKVISKYGGYHGATAGALSASGGRERKSIFEPLLAGYIHVHPPYCYRCPYDASYPSCNITCAKLVEQTIVAEDPETVKAVIMEPISCSSSGFVVPPREFFTILRKACDRHNVLLVFDEIITGFGRLGAMFGADYYGVVPDILACGKGMSGGYAPLAAVLFTDEIQAAFLGDSESGREFFHGHTYGGNPVACSAGIAAVRQILEQDLVQNAKAVGGYLRAKLNAMAATYPLIGEARGAGLLQGIELVKDRATKEQFSNAKPGKMIGRAAKERGLILRDGSHFVVLAPPLIVTEKDVDEICDILEECIDVCQQRLLAG